MIMLVVPAAMGAFHFSSNMHPDPGSVTWEQAHDHCSSLGMNLAMIKSEHEKAVFDAATPMKSNAGGLIYRPHLWLGASTTGDPSNKDGWKWVDGSPLTFEDWHTGKPTSVDSSRKCMEIYAKAQEDNGDFLWSNVRCGSPRSFACSDGVAYPPAPPPQPGPPPPPPSAPPPFPPSQTSTIVGAVSGSVAVCLLSVFAYKLYWRRRRAIAARAISSMPNNPKPQVRCRAGAAYLPYCLT